MAAPRAQPVTLADAMPTLLAAVGDADRSHTETRGLRLQVGVEPRGAPVPHRIEQCMQAGEIGELRALNFLHSCGPGHQSE